MRHIEEGVESRCGLARTKMLGKLILWLSLLVQSKRQVLQRSRRLFTSEPCLTVAHDKRAGESRLSLLSRNLQILSSIFGAMSPVSPHTILLLVANPVDILTYFARKLSGLPESQVLGTGTSLDSARLRGILAQKTEVAPNSIDAYVLGEHGDSQFIAWSSASVGTTPLKLVLGDKLNDEFKAEIAAHTRGAAASIIAAKVRCPFANALFTSP